MWFWTEVLGGCGCGNSDELADRAVALLGYFATPHDERDTKDNPYNNEVLEVLAHWMDSKELIEHGGGVGGSWLTARGQQAYDVLKSFPAVRSPIK